MDSNKKSKESGLSPAATPRRILPAFDKVDGGIMNVILLLLAGFAFMMLLAGCAQDKPPEPDTPEPPPLDGKFVGEYGSMEFNGDGESVHIDFNEELFAEADATNDDNYSYYFLWDSFGLCRYDVATRLRLHHIPTGKDITFLLDRPPDGSSISIVTDTGLNAVFRLEELP